MRSFRLASTLLLVTAVSLPTVAADPPASTAPKNALAKPPVTKSAAPAKPAARPLAPLSADREAAALAFAREHHPELFALIDKLRHDNRREYDRAIRELSQASERMTRLKKVSAEQYELALTAWKLDSRTKLLAAKMTVSPTPGLEAELKNLLAERADVRLKEYQTERARLQDRLGKLNTWIKDLENDRNAVVEKDVQRVMRSVARSRRPAKKPAGKTAPRAIASKPPATSPAVIEPPRPPAVPTAASVNGQAPSGSRASDQQH
jgi:hypothetical protein